jgi:hypothetical protein
MQAFTAFPLGRCCGSAPQPERPPKQSCTEQPCRGGGVSGRVTAAAAAGGGISSVVPIQLFSILFIHVVGIPDVLTGQIGIPFLRNVQSVYTVQHNGNRMMSGSVLIPISIWDN